MTNTFNTHTLSLAIAAAVAGPEVQPVRLARR